MALSISQTLSPSLPPILIVDQDPAFLHNALKGDFPHLRFELCSAIEEAEQRLRTKRYQTLITNVRFVASQGSLIYINQSEQWTAPCVVTAQRAQDTALVQQALRQGAIDCILKPVNRYQAIPTIQAALWLFQLRNHIAYRKHTLRDFKNHSEILPSDASEKAERAKLIEDLTASHEKTLAAIEHSIELLTRTAIEVEQKAKQRALARLDESLLGLV